MPLIERATDYQEGWNKAAPGIVQLPSGRLLRGRGLYRPLPDGPAPDFGLYLSDDRPPAVDWVARWVRWPDFRLPRDHADAADAFREAWHRAVTGRVEIACWRGRGRTGTALACIAVIDGIPPEAAVKFIRENYHPRAIDTPWQRRYVTHFQTR